MTRASVRSGDSPASGMVVLSDERRSSLIDQLFAMQQRARPSCHVCFCGSDGQLVEAVTEMRERLKREHGDEEPEL